MTLGGPSGHREDGLMGPSVRRVRAGNGKISCKGLGSPGVFVSEKSGAGVVVIPSSIFAPSRIPAPELM